MDNVVQVSRKHFILQQRGRRTLLGYISLYNMVVLYGDRVIKKSIMPSAATVHFEEVQDFRVHPIVQQHGCRMAIV